MVKSDVKIDYYADLDLLPTADAEEIKKQFRTLAKLYHPDRNPGRELEVTAKFQAVQAAHEILSDPQLKAKYDADRARQEKTKRDVVNAFRRNAGHPTTTNFPPPSRSATTGARGPPFNPPSGRARPPPPPPPPPPPSSGADKYAAFTRARTQPRDRAEEEAQKAAYDAFRAFRSMRNGQSQPFPTPPPPRPSAHPTAPRPDTSTPPPGSLPRHHRSYEHFQNMPQTGFPGMSRTASARKPAEFAPGTPGANEPIAQRTSAYKHVHEQHYDSYFPNDNIPRSPTTTARPEPATSPLKKSLSSTNLKDASRQPRRPEVERISTRYATSGGEKTYVNGAGRSASVRNSPVEREWGGYEDDDLRRPYPHHVSSARHQSASPNLRHTHATKELSSSESDSSSDAEPEDFASRPKAKPRPRRQKAGSGGFAFRHVAADDPTVNSQFPPPNHKHAHSPQDDYTMRYEYPPPPPRSDPRVFQEPQPFQSNGNSRTDDIREHMRHISAEDPRTHPNMYGTFHSPSQTWSQDWGFSPSKVRKAGPSLNGLPSWAVPSSVLPQQKSSAPKECLETFTEQNVGKMQDLFSHATPLFNKRLLFSKADHVSRTSYSGAHEPGNRPYPQPGYQNVSQEHINTTFSAADWHDKFNSGDEHFRPTTAREGKSPSRTTRTRARSVGRGRMSPNKGDHSSEPIDLTSDSDGRKEFEAQDQNGRDRAGMPTAQAFPPGKFSAEEWAAKLKDQNWAMPSSELNSNNPKTPKKPSKSGGVRRPTIPTKDDTDAAHNDQSRVASKFVSETAIPDQSHFDATFNGGRRASSGDVADAMDIDDSVSDTVPLAPQASNAPHNRDQPAPPCEYPTTADVNLNNLANVAPFAPSSTGLKDMDDLSTNLPFESRAAPDVHHSKTVPGSSSDLRLPKPPKPINSPAHIDEVSWKGYVADMNAYFYDWSVFNKKMIEHFRSRQEQVDMSMASHWISMIGDGPPPKALDGSKAGYATFMAWLEEDAKVRQWWDVANERNKQCFEDLGKTRARVKAASGPAPF